MANPQLKGLAEDLEKVLAEIKPKPVVVSRPKKVVEDTSGVARAIFEYVLHRAPEGAPATMVGDALVVGIKAAALELNLKPADLMRAVESYVSCAISSAQETLAETE